MTTLILSLLLGGGFTPGTGGSSSGGYDTIQDEGTPLAQRTVLNFAGASVTCVDDTTRTTCTISSSGGGTSPLILSFGGF